MSGLLSSLLIEPVIRQARRLSQQTSPRPSSDSLTAGKDCAAPLASDGDQTSQGAVMTDFTHPGLLSNGGDAGSEDGRTLPSASPPDHLPIGPSHEQEHRFPPGWTTIPSQDRLPQTSHFQMTRTNLSISPQQTVSVPATQDASQPSSPHSQPPEQVLSHNLMTEEPGCPVALPEDDGMGALRRRIHAIRDLGYSNTDQARMIHALMTEKYNSHRSDSADQQNTPRSPSPLIPQSPKQDETARRWSIISLERSSPLASSAPVKSESYNLTAEDLLPTYAPKPELESPACEVDDLDTEEVEEVFLGCEHYKTNVKSQCFDCKKWYTCRFCHDEVEEHRLDRPKTENMLCMLCGEAQPAAQSCRKCGEQAAQYYCETCKLWDNDANKSIYHCSDCGICRIGKGLGKDFFHCKTCSVCLPISIENTHRCIERSTQCDCPICGDYMFTSPETVVFMRCGHSIHQRCLSEYSRTSYRCPICSKTITNMESTFRNLDRTIESQPMPAEFKDTKALVYCNDCSAKSVVRYHWLGLRCDLCESYNTAQIRLVRGNDSDPSALNSDTEDISTTRARSSSHGADESGLSTFESLRIDTSSVPGHESQLSVPMSADPSRQFASYSLTRDRAVSPVIRNYFGIPPDRGSNRSQSTSFFSGLSFGGVGGRRESEDGGELRLWGTKIKYSYGFLGQENESVDGASDADIDEDEDGGASGNSGSEHGSDEEDDDDESIDIFGHR
ncbi:RING finger and CHY zinc finger domain-containing protein [Aspergillus homomorphus CBS 101889]|uniref:Zf-CHY-domain-containing protein n=1 Tax=Aspergillus homomorphus (strain CBS 101889) TaxID=1450537 RepID=A0A395HPS1_ASPHC|nr:zf-CHY-domain-containing protein [Aspergillus homomorphus CBS 101889]RAL09265.1 zf-CHY-domain-containing protein [Aspergillus homomorphus CBS 101889]